MFDNVILVASQVAVLFLLMAAGALCRWLRLIDGAAEKGVVNVLVYVVTPCLIVDCFQRPFDPARMKSLAVAFAVVFALHAVLIAASRLVAGRGGSDTTRVLRLATVFSNAGFMGIPLEQALYGEDGVFYGVAYVVAFNFIIWSWGYCTMARGGEGGGRGGFPGLGREQLRAAVLNPGLMGIAVALPLFATSTALPGPVAAGVRHLSNLNTPLAMLVIGYHLAGAKLGAVARMPRAYAAAAARLVVCPVALAFALLPFKGRIDAVMSLTLVTAASAPVAALVSMLSAKFDRDVDASVGLVAGTTLLSIATMPAVIAFAMKLLG